MLRDRSERARRSFSFGPFTLVQLYRLVTIVGAGGIGKTTVALEQMGALSWQLRSANDLAHLWRSRSRDDDAFALLRPIFDSFREGFEFHDLIVASDLLTRLGPAGRH